jgi:hypothetical protein
MEQVRQLSLAAAMRQFPSCLSSRVPSGIRWMPSHRLCPMGVRAAPDPSVFALVRAIQGNDLRSRVVVMLWWRW